MIKSSLHLNGPIAALCFVQFLSLPQNKVEKIQHILFSITATANAHINKTIDFIHFI